MAIIMYNDMEQYVTILREKKAVEKNLPLYISKLQIPKKITNDIIQITGGIQFQINTGGDAHTYQLIEDMPTYHLIPNQFFTIAVSDEKMRTLTQKDYEASIKTYEEQLQQEYDKAKKLAKELSYDLIYEGSIQ